MRSAREEARATDLCASRECASPGISLTGYWIFLIVNNKVNLDFVFDCLIKDFFLYMLYR